MTRPTLRDPRLHPFAGQDLPSLMDLQASRQGARPFLIWKPESGAERRWSYAQFAADTMRLAKGLAKRGILKGDRLLIHLENCPEFLLAWFACARLGAIAVTTNTRSSGKEMDYLAKSCRARGAITQPAFCDLLQTHCTDLEWIAVTETDSGQDAMSGQGAAAHEQFELLFQDTEHRLFDSPDPWAPLSVMYTSGTTSRPKGVLWTHGNALWGGRVASFLEGLTPGDVFMVFLPLFHCNALVNQVLSAFWAGASIVLLRRFSAKRFWPIDAQPMQRDRVRALLCKGDR
jgi:crotonobetaine/carnitine-CoA ligase